MQLSITKKYNRESRQKTTDWKETECRENFTCYRCYRTGTELSTESSHTQSQPWSQQSQARSAQKQDGVQRMRITLFSFAKN